MAARTALLTALGDRRRDGLPNVQRRRADQRCRIAARSTLRAKDRNRWHIRCGAVDIHPRGSMDPYVGRKMPIVWVPEMVVRSAIAERPVMRVVDGGAPEKAPRGAIPRDTRSNEPVRLDNDAGCATPT